MNVYYHELIESHSANSLLSLQIGRLLVWTFCCCNMTNSLYFRLPSVYKCDCINTTAPTVIRVSEFGSPGCFGNVMVLAPFP